jgi:hypothetical protein
MSCTIFNLDGYNLDPPAIGWAEAVRRVEEMKARNAPSGLKRELEQAREALWNGVPSAALGHINAAMKELEPGRDGTKTVIQLGDKPFQLAETPFDMDESGRWPSLEVGDHD